MDLLLEHIDKNYWILWKHFQESDDNYTLRASTM